MSQTKNSLGKDWSGLTSLKYTIDSTIIDTEEGPAEVGMFVWGGVAERSVGDIVRDRGDQEDRGERDEVDKWLKVLLTGQRLEAGLVFKAADLAGYSKDQAKRAKKRLHVLAKHPEIKGPWYWELPTEDEDEDEDEPPREHQGSKGAQYTEPCSLAPLSAPLRGDPDRQTCTVCGQILLLSIVGRSVCERRDDAHVTARAEAVA
jgi:hypothetical protein